MAGRAVKISADQWIAAARVALIEEGIAGVKVDRLATRLNVTRGGFYHNFRDRDEFFGHLLHDWETTCRITPPISDGLSPAGAVRWLESFSDRLIHETGYDHSYDLAVREWGRSDQNAAAAIAAIDLERIDTLTTLFKILGCEPDEAVIRARVFYYHQIGYYAIGVQESIETREANAPLYLDILCGSERLRKARATQDVSPMLKSVA